MVTSPRIGCIILRRHISVRAAALEAHLVAWTRDVAEVRVHGTTGEAPLVRFLRDEAHALQPLADRPSFQPMREWVRRVQADCTIELQRNWYSVPWALLGETVRVVQQGERLTIHHGASVVAEHQVAVGTRVRRVDPAHPVGITARRATPETLEPPARPPRGGAAASTLLRPLSEYAAVVGECVAEVAA